MLSSIIWDIYHIDLEELKDAYHSKKPVPVNIVAECSTQGSDSGPSPALEREDMVEVIRGAQDKMKQKRVAADKARAEAKMDCMVAGLREMNVEQKMTPEMQAALAELMRQDEWNFQPGKLKFKSDKDKDKKGKGSDRQ